MIIYIEIKDQVKTGKNSGQIRYNLFEAKINYTWSERLDKEPFWDKGKYLQNGVYFLDSFPLSEQEATKLVERFAKKKYPKAEFAHHILPDFQEDGE